MSTFNAEQDSNLREHLKEVDYSEPASIKVLYQFKMRTRQELEDISKDAKVDYKTTMMNACRVAALVEKLKVIKKNVGRKLRINEAMKAFEF